MNIADILNSIKERHQLKTNTALAELLDIDFRRIPEYYKGREPMDDDYPKIAMACGKRVDELQTIYKLSTSTDEKTLAIWSRYSKSIGRIAAGFMSVFFALVTLIVTPTPAEAAPALKKPTPHFVLCK